MRTFEVGDLVKYRPEFLRNIGWYTGVPKNGMVEAVNHPVGGRYPCLVRWCDSVDPVLVLDSNLMHYEEPDHG